IARILLARRGLELMVPSLLIRSNAVFRLYRPKVPLPPSGSGPKFSDAPYAPKKAICQKLGAIVGAGGGGGGGGGAPFPSPPFVGWGGGGGGGVKPQSGCL